MDPSEDEISQVIDFAGLNPVDDRFLVTQALKSNSRNTEAVIMQYFDNPESFRQKYQSAWDDSMFAADRDGTNNQSGISFHIESPDQNGVIQGVTPPPDKYTSGAPSRPPSRNNSLSPLSRMIDWTAQNGPDVPNTQAQEDEDMQRALRESAQEAGISMMGQETGVTGPSDSTPHFGPANRNDYETANWAMVPVAAATAKLDTTPAPSLRKRVADAPALLIKGNGSADAHRLAGLLTILHEIPLARNVLLDTGSPAASYGHNSEWWTGQEILPPHVLAQLQSEEQQWGARDVVKPDFDEELHRLMAFLDSTERGYGSASVMADLVSSSSCDAEKQFYEYLTARNGFKVQPLCQVASLAEVRGDGVGYEDATFGLLDIDHVKGDYGVIQTLYESLDHVMWNDVLGWNEVHEAAKMALFKEMGEVFVVRISGDGPEESIEIPAEFYPERYLTSRKDEARRIQIGWCKTKTEMARVVKEQEKVQQWRDGWNNQVYDRKALIMKAADQWKGYNEYLEGLGRFQTMERTGFDTEKYPDYRAVPCDLDDEARERVGRVNGVVKFCEQLLSDLERKLKDLNEELERIKARQRFLGKLLTVPDKPGRPKAMTCNKYHLRGVATATDVVYVCQRAEADLLQLDDVPPAADQWWKLAYSPNEAKPVIAEKIDMERVFRDMWQETKTPLLVYATDKALDTPRSALSAPLERFMKAENKAFRQELNQEAADKAEPSETRRVTLVDPISPPSKRKHRSDSADSMDSNRASIGSDDRNGFDNPFVDHEDSVETETTATSAGNASELAHSVDARSSPAPLFSQPPHLPLPKRPSSAANTPPTTPARAIEASDQIVVPYPAQIGTSAEARNPEMQERAGPPAFISLSRTPSATKDSVSLMDMDISEPHEQGK